MSNPKVVITIPPINPASGTGSQGAQGFQGFQGSSGGVGFAEGYMPISSSGYGYNVKEITKKVMFISGLNPEVGRLYKINLDDPKLFVIDATGGEVTLALPPANTVEGKEFIFKRIDQSGHSTKVIAVAPDRLDGMLVSVHPIFNCGDSYRVISDGVSNWYSV